MAQKTVLGVCHICGKETEMSFEHVPPKAAFNNHPVVIVELEKYFEVGPFGPVKGKVCQRGAGDHTLCTRCNNQTGAWYGGHFADWCQQGMMIVSMSVGKPTLVYIHRMYPLSIIKQILVMFLSTNSLGFRLKNPYLEGFVMEKEKRYLDPKYRFFIYYNTSSSLRSTGISGVLTGGRNSTMSEISFPPFGYVMTFDSPPPDPRLFEITHFARYRYKEFALVDLRMPCLPTVTPFPGDYRTPEQIRRDEASNRESLRGAGKIG